MRAAAALAVLALLGQAPAAAEPHISDLKAAVDGRKVRVSFRLQDGFDEVLRERIQSGLPTGIVYDMQLMKDRKHWWDKSLADSSLQVVAMFNAVTREYLVNFKLDGRLVESRQLREIGELEEALTRIQSLPAFDLAPLPGDWRLLVAVRAELGSSTLLAFIPTHLRTDWAESRKFSPPAN